MNLAFKPKCSQSGFTLVELITVMVILGVLAATAMPRFFNSNTFDSRGFRDQVISMLRYAQKTAVSQRGNVFVRLDGTSVALCFDAACANPVTAPAGGNSGSTATMAACAGNNLWMCEAPKSGTTYASVNGLFFFNALGKPFNNGDVPPLSTFVTLNITFSGGQAPANIIVEAETGYVH
jgi:MSHA pilin protein MshC